MTETQWMPGARRSVTGLWIIGRPSRMPAMGFGRLVAMGQPNLTSTDGRRWAVWSAYNIMSRSHPDEVQMRRWRVVETPCFGLYVHKIMRPDAERDLHDHPWSFGSLVLVGGYEEELADTWRTWRQGSWRRMRPTEPHAIRRLLRAPTWTVVVRGRRQRAWGFRMDGRFVHHEDYSYS